RTLLSPCCLTLSPPPPRPTLFPYTTLFRSSRRSPRAPATRRAPRRCSASPGRGSSQSSIGTGSRARANRARNSWRLYEDDLPSRSEEHTSELQSLRHLVCRLLLEKKNNHT